MVFNLGIESQFDKCAVGKRDWFQLVDFWLRFPSQDLVICEGGNGLDFVLRGTMCGDVISGHRL